MSFFTRQPRRSDREIVAGEGLASFTVAFWRYGRWQAVGAGALLAGGAVLEGAGLLLLVPLLYLAMPGQTAAPAHWRWIEPVLAHFGAPGSQGRLLTLLTSFAAVMVARAMVLSWRDRALAGLQAGFVEAVRARLVERIADADWAEVNALSHASVVQALSVEVHDVGAAAHSLVMASVSAVLLLGNCILAMMLAPVAGSVALLCGLVGMGMARSGLGRVRRLGEQATQAHLSMTASALGFMTGLKFAAAQGLTGEFTREHHAIAQKATRDRLAFIRLKSRLREGTAAMAALAGAGMLFAGIALFHLAAPVLVSLLLVLSRMIGPVQVVQQTLQQIVHTLPAYDRVLALERALCQPAGERWPMRAVSLAAPGIRLTGVTLAHGHGQPVLAGFDLALPQGVFLGMVGPSGCGKSSLLDLFAGLQPARSGEVQLLGRNLLSPEDLAAHREDLAYAGAEPFLLEGSVRRNLAWSCRDVSEAEMWAALETVEAAQVVQRLEGGLDAAIGERGSQLSAGERQRLALARALLRRPRLLLLDEATNAIDIACEHRILKRLAAMTPAVTIVFVTHRHEGLRFCDHVLHFPGPVLQRRVQASESDADAAHDSRAVQLLDLVKPHQI